MLIEKVPSLIIQLNIGIKSHNLFGFSLVLALVEDLNVITDGQS